LVVGIIYTGKVHIFVSKYYFAFQFYTKGIILVRFKHEMEIGQNQSVIWFPKVFK
jgi:hypothetical protein